MSAPPFEIRKAGPRLPSRVVMVGVEGVGKTGLAAQFKDPFFLMSKGETGLETLIDSGQLRETPHFPELLTWKATLDALEWVENGEHNHRHIVLDAVTGFERLYMDDVIRTEFEGKAENFSAYGRNKTYQHLGWEAFLSRLMLIREKRRMGIILLAHASIKAFKNPEGNDYDRYVPRMNDQIWERTFAWADIVLFMNFVTLGAKDKGALRAKGKDTGRRVIYTERRAAWDAKNRHNLPPEIDMGTTPEEAHENFLAAMREAKANSQPINGAAAPVAASV